MNVFDGELQLAVKHGDYPFDTELLEELIEMSAPAGPPDSNPHFPAFCAGDLAFGAQAEFKRVRKTPWHVRPQP